MILENTVAEEKGGLGGLRERVTKYAGEALGVVGAVGLPAQLVDMFGEGWLKGIFSKSMDTERLSAMVDAGRLFKDAREVAGLSKQDLAKAMGLSTPDSIDRVEEGKDLLSFEMIFRSASLIARHDPIPFIIKLMRTYNPRLGRTMEKWGVSGLPKQYERERRFINIYRKHDRLREFSDDEYDRLITYVNSATELVMDVMAKEKEAVSPAAGKSSNSDF